MTDEIKGAVAQALQDNQSGNNISPQAYANRRMKQLQPEPQAEKSPEVEEEVIDTVQEEASIEPTEQPKKKKSWFGKFTADTLSKAIPKAEGGPIEAGKPYLVGEKGPEVIIPSSDGNVLSNDDSQIYAMLLASNPQLQKVSRARAEKILRARFPEYFE